MTIDAYTDLRRIVREEMKALRLAELAVVQETHPHAAQDDDDNYACTVRLRDTDLVLVRVPVMTARKGMAAIPDIGDLVLVQFLGGDPNAPIITGSLYNDEDRPPENAEGEIVLRLPADASEGEGVELRVTSADAATAKFALGGALKIELKDDDPVVVLEVGDNTASLTIESDGTVTLKSSNALVLEVSEVIITGTTIKAEAQGEMTLKAPVINLN